MREEESGAISEIGRRGEVEVGEEAREVSGGGRVVEEVFAEEEIAGVEFERGFDVDRWPAQSHYPKC